MVNTLWLSMFLIAFIIAIGNIIFNHDISTFDSIIKAIFDNAQLGVKISIGLIGILSFWLGILKIIEEAGIAKILSKKLTPLFRIIMKDVPENSPAISTVVLNMSANFLGLDNAATPMGIKAMKELQEHNPKKDEASDAQILFMILNASSVTLIPITIFMYRMQLGATRPTDVFIPILLSTSVSTIVGFLLVAIKQKIKLTNKILLKWIVIFFIIISSISFVFYLIEPEKRLVFSSGIGNILLSLIILSVFIIAIKNKINCYDCFITGAKEGFNVSITILPYLVAMLVVIGVFRASNALDLIVETIKHLCSIINIDTTFVDALPTALMKPLSGSGARAMMIETMQNHGADSFVSFISCVIQGSTETTFYVLSVYFGAINIYKTRYALKYALISDIAGILSAIFFSYLFYNA